jgi:hypothetical protein
VLSIWSITWPWYTRITQSGTVVAKYARRLLKIVCRLDYELRIHEYGRQFSAKLRTSQAVQYEINRMVCVHEYVYDCPQDGFAIRIEKQKLQLTVDASLIQVQLGEYYEHHYGQCKHDKYACDQYDCQRHHFYVARVKIETIHGYGIHNDRGLLQLLFLLTRRIAYGHTRLAIVALCVHTILLFLLFFQLIFIIAKFHFDIGFRGAAACRPIVRFEEFYEIPEGTVQASGRVLGRRRVWRLFQAAHECRRKFCTSYNTKIAYGHYAKWQDCIQGQVNVWPNIGEKIRINRVIALIDDTV